MNGHVSVPVLYSSAEKLSDIRGPTVCFTISEGEGTVVSGAICASFADEHFRDVTSVSVMGGPGLGAAVDAPRIPGPGMSGGLQAGYTGVTELTWLEHATKDAVDYVDDTLNWSDGWRALVNPRSWFG
jgi:hypothetical protein